MQRDELIEELGLGPVWKLRTSTGAVKKGEAPPSALPAVAMASTTLAHEVGLADAVAAPPGDIADGLAWPDLVERIRGCTRCDLCRERKQAVPGVGDLRPDWLFIGEGPGAEEDERGEPFVGQAGKLLDNMLAALDLRRGEKVYIANAVKCRPPGNRTPTPEEVTTCRPYLLRQIELLQPRILVLLGRVAAQSILGGDASLSSLRGRVHRWQGVPVVATYHPAYLLRSLTEKAKAWEDLCLARRTLREPGSASP